MSHEESVNRRQLNQEHENKNRTVKKAVKAQRAQKRLQKKLDKKAEKKALRTKKIQKKVEKRQFREEFKKLPPAEKKRVKKAIKAKKQAERKKRKQIRHAKEPRWMPSYSNRISPDELMNIESEWGGILFGPIPAGHQRNFFEYKKNVWIWYEGWLEKGGVVKSMTIRYEVRPSGVFKRVDGQKYEKISGDELDNFRTAAKNYLTLMKNKLYY